MKNYVINFIKRHRVLILSLLFNAVLLGAMLLLFEPRFETNDDIAMCNMVDGSKGTYDSHLIFINYLVGYLLKKLYIALPIIPWYSVLQYMIVFASLTALTCVMRQRIQSAYCRCAYLVCLISIAYESYIQLQFSKTAAIATMAGIILLLSDLFLDKLSIKRLAAGYVLALAGSFYRFEEFLIVTVLLSGIGLFFLLFLARDKHWKKKLIQCAGIFCGLGILVLGFRQYDLRHYNSEEWKEYIKFNKLRSQLYDYGFPSYEENEKAYNELGIDETANALFSRHVIMDTERISANTFQKLTELKEEQQIDGNLLVSFIRTFFFNVYKIPAFFLALYAYLLLWGFHSKRRREETVVAVYEFLLILVTYFYLYYEGRYFMNRVDMGLWLAVAMTIFWMLTQNSKDFSLRAGITSALILTCAGLYIAYPRFRVNMNTEQKTEIQQEFEEIASDKKHLYLYKVKSLNVDWAYEPLDRLPENVLANQVPLGGWTARTPSDNAILNKYNVRNPFRDIINNKKIYLIDDDIGPTVEYIRKWYNPDARTKVVKYIGNMPVYRIIA